MVTSWQISYQLTVFFFFQITQQGNDKPASGLSQVDYKFQSIESFNKKMTVCTWCGIVPHNVPGDMNWIGQCCVLVYAVGDV